MNSTLRKNINRVINKIYKITSNNRLKLILLNLTTKVFVDKHNLIVHDKTNQLFWLKNKSTYLLGVDKPYFDFSIESSFKRCESIFCKFYNPKQGDIIVDIGAGIGQEICYFKKAIGSSGVLYAIEASSESHNRLKLLINKNNYKNCLPFNLAISNTNGQIWIEENENYRVNKVNKYQNGKEVTCTTLDQFVFDNKISSIDLLKVNIEGAEYEIVDAMLSCVSIINNVAISCHDFLNVRESSIKEKVTQFLKSNNFRVMNVNTGNKILDSWIYGEKLSSKQ